MALVETTPDHERGPELTDIALRLEPEAHELLLELTQRTGCDASDLVGWALGALWRELEGIVLPPPGPPVDMEQLIRKAEEDIRAGRTIPHEEVMAQARKIVGL